MRYAAGIYVGAIPSSGVCGANGQNFVCIYSEDEMEKKIKCKFCEWEIVKYYTDRCGNVRGIDLAIERLDYHVLIEHPAEHAEIQRILEENCADRQRDYDRDENLYGSRLDWPRR